MISSTVARMQYAGAGSVGPFAFNFRIFAYSDLRVVRRSTLNVETVLVYAVDFTATGVGNDTGTITLTTALAAGEVLSILRTPPYTQPVSIRNLGAYFPSVHEDEFDRLTMQMQELSDKVDRSIGVSDTYDPAALLLRLMPETGKALVWQSLTQLGNSAFSSAAVALPGESRTVGNLTAYLINGRVFNSRDYGTVGDGVADDTAAIQLTVTKAFAVGGRAVLPFGTYKITSPIVIPSARGSISGDGLTSTIYFTPSANNQSCFQYVNGDNIVISDLDVNMNNTGGRTGISAFDFANANVSAAWFERVFVTGFNKYGIWLNGAQYLKCIGCRFIGMRNTAAPAEGVRVDGFLNAGVFMFCRFGENDKDMRIQPLGAAVTIAHSSFERSGNTLDGGHPAIGAAFDRIIEIEGVAGLHWINNYTEAPIPGAGNAFLYLVNCIGYKIDSGLWSGEWGGAPVTTRMIEINGGRGSIESSRFDQVSTAFIVVDATLGPIAVRDCSFKRVGVEFVQNQRETLVATWMGGASKKSLEFNNFGTEVAWNPASIANGAGETKGPTTMTGAELGDRVDATFDVDQVGLALTAWVSAADTVQARLNNTTGGAVDLGAGTLRLALRKRIS